MLLQTERVAGHVSAVRACSVCSNVPMLSPQQTRSLGKGEPSRLFRKNAIWEKKGGGSRMYHALTPKSNNGAVVRKSVGVCLYAQLSRLSIHGHLETSCDGAHCPDPCDLYCSSNCCNPVHSSVGKGHWSSLRLIFRSS